MPRAVARHCKGGGGYAPKNLQVLDNNTFPNSMQSYVQALGVADQSYYDSSTVPTGYGQYSGLGSCLPRAELLPAKPQAVMGASPALLRSH